MLIDYTYFFGDLLVAQLETDEVKDELNWLINEHEQDVLTAMLGYPLYKALLEGLAVDPVASKWTDLLFGAEYTNRYGVLDKWIGIIAAASGQVLTLASANPASEIVVNRGRDQYDPAPDSSTTIIPPEFVGKSFDFFQRAFGFLRTDEFTVAGNLLTLTGGIKFSDGDTYFYKSATAASIALSSTDQKKSLIANYVYYWYLRNHSSNTTGTTEAASQNQNSKPCSSIDKQARAWNQMVSWNKELFEFLYSNRTVYTQFDLRFNTPSANKRHSFMQPIGIL